MEKAFKLNNSSRYLILLETYLDTVQNNNILISKLFKRLGIESTKYYLCGDGFVNQKFDTDEKKNIELSIFPTENDKLKFSHELCKPDNAAMCKFRLSSKIMKEIQDYCIENNMIINPDEPDLREYFKSMSWKGYRRELFKFNDIWYLKLFSDRLAADDMPDGFEEIKLSEYYLLIEKYSEAENKKLG